MVRSCTAALVLVAACGAPTSSHIENASSRQSTKMPCPKEPDLAAFVGKLWNAKPEDKVENLTCIPVVRHRLAHWWLEGEVRPPEKPGGEYLGSTRHRSLVVADGRTVAWTKADEPNVSFVGTEWQGSGTDDFDGDGNDEVWYVEITGEGGASGTNLYIVDVAGEPVTVQMTLGFMNGAGEHTCNGDWKLIKRGKERLIEVTREGDCDTMKLRERFVLRGKELVPAP